MEATGKTQELAIAAALKELNKDRDEVSVEVLEVAKSGFLGIGASPARVRVSYEVAETQRERTERFLSGLLEHMGVEAELEITERENGGLNVNLRGEVMGAVIGRRGETLDAIQHLANYAVNRGSEKRAYISVDAEGYRSKREDSLVRLAEKMAAKAIKYRRSMALEPMNSYERHVIHTALQDYEGVSTSSTGTEPNRRVVVNYERGRGNDRGNGTRGGHERRQNAPAEQRREEHETPAKQPEIPENYERPQANKPVSREWS
ncbi:MAG: RNA-binding cell elongation regulator Jag/EloR [Eubacteriales bacterium]|nr:RNA-binding cell elongation regulator Jag/EloR [Eubacteriales bacterium]